MSILFCIPGCHFLQPQEQLFVKGWTDASVVNGPGFKVVSGTKVASKRSGITLGPTQYLLIEDTLTGTRRIEVGPGLIFLGAYDRSLGQKEALALKHNQYVKLHDKVSGVIKVVKGEGLVFLQPEEVELDGGVKNAIEIDDRRSVLIRELDSGQLKLITEKQLFFPTALQQIIEIREPQVLDITDYLHIKDLRNGEVTMIKGPLRFFPGPYEEIQKRGVAISLKHNQYVKVLDTRSGIISVVRGEHVLFPGPFDQIQGGIQKAYEIDEHHAVLIRNTQSGQQELLTDPQLFFPTWDQEVLEVRKRIVLEDHEVMIIKEKDGRYKFHSGANPEQRSFFLPPYCEVEEVSWSTGLMLEDHSKKMSRFDMRPQFLTYEFTARTCDNVELILDVTFFWQILNVEKMIRKTEDAPGDLCAHARSNIIQSVSKATLEKFLSEFNPIARAAIFDADDSFYDERGFVIHRVEVRNIKCKDPNTERVLQEIIQETTNRLKSLQKQQSENEVKIFKLKGEIAEEKLNGDLLSIRHQHHRAAALMEGEAEADRVQAFLSGIENAPLEVKVGLFNTLRKCDALNSVAKKNTTMYFTPSDVNLSIETVQSVRALPTLAEVSEDAVAC